MRQINTLGAHILNQKQTTNDKKKNSFGSIINEQKKKNNEKKTTQTNLKYFITEQNLFQLATDKRLEPNRNIEVV